MKILSKDNLKTVALGILMVLFFPITVIAYMVWTGGKLAREMIEDWR